LDMNDMYFTMFIISINVFICNTYVNMELSSFNR